MQCAQQEGADLRIRRPPMGKRVHQRIAAAVAAQSAEDHVHQCAAHRAVRTQPRRMCGKTFPAGYARHDRTRAREHGGQFRGGAHSVQQHKARAGFERITVNRLVNRYPLGYWLRLAPGPAGVKAATAAALGRMRLDGLPLSVPAGNLVAVGHRQAP